MNCRGVSRRLSAYIDDELSPGIKSSVDEHLRKCRACSRKLSDLTAISGAARMLPPLKVSSGFKDRVLESIGANRNGRILPGGIRLKLSLAGVAFAVAAASVFFIAGPQSGFIDQEMADQKTMPEVKDVLKNPVPDFNEDPTVKITSFPIPDSSRALELVENDSLLKGDSTMRIDEFVLPVVEKSKENVNIKF